MKNNHIFNFSFWPLLPMNFLLFISFPSAFMTPVSSFFMLFFTRSSSFFSGLFHLLIFLLLKSILCGITSPLTFLFKSLLTRSLPSNPIIFSCSLLYSSLPQMFLTSCSCGITCSLLYLYMCKQAFLNYFWATPNFLLVS